MRIRRGLRHPFRFISRLMVLRWAWRNRHDLVRWSRFALRLPTELRSRELDDIVVEARARIALSADPRTRLAPDIDIARFENGALVVQAPLERPIAETARAVLDGVSGVDAIELVDERPSVTVPDDRTLREPVPT